MSTKDFLTTGEFAQLACTTKRTIRFYDKKGILSPTLINQKGYRFYKQEQILDFQVILLLRKLGMSLDEIHKYVKEDIDLKTLFQDNKSKVLDKIKNLEYIYTSLNKYYKNLETNGTMVDPEEKIVEKFEIFYIEKEGSYSQIGDFCEEILYMFSEMPEKVTTLAVFLDNDYRPRKSNMLIGVIKDHKFEIKQEFHNDIQEETIDSYKALSYTHNGPGSTLSMFWKQLEKYMALNKDKYQRDLSRPTLEFYREVSEKDRENLFEINIPLKESHIRRKRI